MATITAPRTGWRYPGWGVVAIGFVIFFFAFSGVATLPFIYQEAMAEFHWSLSETQLYYAFQSGTGAVMAIFIIGPLIERFGLKPVMVGSMLAEGIGMASFLLINSLGAYYFAGFLIGLGTGSILIGVKLLVSRWFTRNVGLAGGIAIIGSSVGGVVFPLVATHMIPEFGWRAAFAFLSIGVLFISIPLTLIARANPTEEEILPEALASARSAAGAERVRGAELAEEFGQLICQPMFYAISLAIFFVAGVDQSIFQHTVLFLTTEGGLSRGEAAYAVSFTFVAGMLAKFVAGRFFDWLSIRGVAIWYVLLALVVLLAFPVAGLITAMIFTAGRGIVHGGLVVEGPVIAKHIYGPRHMNRILPIFAGFFSLGSATGPWALAKMQEATGSYREGFIACIILSLVAAALLLWQARPLYRDRLRAIG
jgi:MFS family permease